MSRHCVASFLCLCIALVFLAGCSSDTLVKDDTQQSREDTSPCSGSEWADDSTMASVPIPLVAFLVPHPSIHTIKADDYLKRCGDTTKLVNREVDVSHAACVPAAVTRVITLGIWQWCPAYISWNADVRP